MALLTQVRWNKLFIFTFEHMLSKQATGDYDPTLYQRMTAYRRHYSCQTTLRRLVEDWKSAVDRKELVYILTTDMSKAFDSLCHSLIVKKLEAYGFGLEKDGTWLSARLVFRSPSVEFVPK